MSLDRWRRQWGAVLEAVRGEDPPHACRHVVTGANRCICIRHPKAGLLCAECMKAHLDRHEDLPPCDVCGAPGALRPFALAVEAGLRSVTHPGGMVAVLLPGRVYVTGGRLCGACNIDVAEVE